MSPRVRFASASWFGFTPLLTLLAAILAFGPAHSNETEYAEVTNWASGSDPLKIVISLDNQHLTVYRGTEAISSTKISTGKRGYRTPAGVFSILQKRKWHRSNIYSNAPMPYMQRLTWSGIALHEGYVPNHPASHGCIRLPGKFARQLFSMTELGAQVFITKGETKPETIKHGKLLQPRPLDLVTMNERDVMLRWAQEQGGPLKWIPLPVKSTDTETEQVSYSATNTSAPVDKDPEKAGAEEISPERHASLKLADLEYDLSQMEFYKNRSVEPLRILITHREGAERVQDVQRLLRELGHDPGDVDGYVGRDTRTAIRSYQEAHGLKATGEITEELVQMIYKQAKSSPPSSGHIYVKQDRRNILDAPVAIADPEKPLGTHLLSVMNFSAEDEKADWQVISANEENEAAAALERITLPADVRNRLERMLTPGSSIIISDGGLNPETNKFTDFIVTMN
jgi:peptidoglycan hydrolase-like protein with peptidoglycan-binding domain